MKIRPYILLFLLSSLVISCSPSADKGLEQVNNLVNTGKVSDAVRLSTTLIGRYPDDPRFHYIRGFCYLSIRALSDAEADFERCIKIDPKYSGGYKGMGSLSAIKGMYDAAEKNYRTAYELATTNDQKSSIMQNIGSMYSGEIKNQKKAIEFFNQSIQLNDLGDWRFGLALAYYRDNRKEEAVSIWMKSAGENNFKNVYFKHATYYQLAAYYDEKKNYARAQEYIQKALALDPHNSLYMKTSRDIIARLKK